MHRRIKLIPAGPPNPSPLPFGKGWTHTARIINRQPRSCRNTHLRALTARRPSRTEQHVSYRYHRTAPFFDAPSLRRSDAPRNGRGSSFCARPRCPCCLAPSFRARPSHVYAHLLVVDVLRGAALPTIQQRHTRTLLRLSVPAADSTRHCRRRIWDETRNEPGRVESHARRQGKWVAGQDGWVIRFGKGPAARTSSVQQERRDGTDERTRE